MAKNTTGNIFDVNIFKRLLTYTRPYKKTFYFVGVAAILLSCFSVVRPYLSKVIVDEGIIPKDSYNLMYYGVAMVIALIFEVVFQFLFIYYANWLGQEVIRDLRDDLFKHIIAFKKQYYDTSAVGRLVTRAVNDIETIASIFSSGLFMIVSDLLKMLVVLAVMFFQSWVLALIVVAIMPFIIYATRVFQKKMKSAFEDVRNQVSNLNSYVQERLTGMKILQIFNRERIEYKRFKDINNNHRKAWVRTVWYNSIFFPIAEIATSVTIGIIVWVGGLRVMEGNSMSLGEIIMFIQLIQMLFRPLRQIADKFNTLQMGMVAANRIFKIIDTDSQILDSGKIEAKNLQGDIEFRDVHFSYVEDEEVLKGLSFKVKAGETIAIVGATGAGKSTVINLLSRFYEIDSGKILVDGKDIKDYSLRSLRSEIAVVLQDVFLFADSVISNITLDKSHIDDDDAVEAAQEIGVHDFIQQLPNAYHYNVKERGAMLSSGQRQLIAFLRAYVSNPSILVLDEATSSVDSYSEQLIQEATDRITKGRTSVVIAHRLATIKNADKILVMDKGRIVEAGSHQELLQIQDGYYKNLYEVQFMEEEVN
jgi:subfamily B ATP-binding cassette protein MsbA